MVNTKICVLQGRLTEVKRKAVKIESGPVKEIIDIIYGTDYIFA